MTDNTLAPALLSDIRNMIEEARAAVAATVNAGLTLLLHINYRQFLHYHRLARAKPLDNILLITPNSGLSEQHLAEFAKSGIPAQRFRGSGGVGLDRETVQVLEITKLTERSSGPLTVHVDSFEGNNLVFVDEGHRGSSGEVWLGLRDKLAAEGFTLEYSATFGEALNKGGKPADMAQRQSYGKAVVFDYSYRYFYGDGYGKEYNILNLPAGLQSTVRRCAAHGQPAGILRADAAVRRCGRGAPALPDRAAAAGVRRPHRADRQDREPIERRGQSQPQRRAEHGALPGAGRAG